ncbi:hypothetical protein HK405_011392 [Cladochytrium tenue]|nr:hypothetical protein HK405_011392 [Cladochytrium tenue]
MHPLFIFNSPLPHSPLPASAEVCLIAKEPESSVVASLTAANSGGSTSDAAAVNHVVGIPDLEGEYRPFEARRRLCAAYDLFLADDRILPALSRLLGKVFFDKKKLPAPVDLTRSDVRAEIAAARCAAHMHPARGTCTTVRVATTAHDQAAIVDNIVAAIDKAVPRLYGGWGNVASIAVKTTRSPTLPVYVTAANPATVAAALAAASAGKAAKAAAKAAAADDAAAAPRRKRKATAAPAGPVVDPSAGSAATGRKKARKASAASALAAAAVAAAQPPAQVGTTPAPVQHPLPPKPDRSSKRARPTDPPASSATTTAAAPTAAAERAEDGAPEPKRRQKQQKQPQHPEIVT